MERIDVNLANFLTEQLKVDSQKVVAALKTFYKKPPFEEPDQLEKELDAIQPRLDKKAVKSRLNAINLKKLRELKMEEARLDCLLATQNAAITKLITETVIILPPPQPFAK